MNNWEFFRQQWTDYEVATSLDKQEQKIRLATFRSVMGKECLQIFLLKRARKVNLKFNSKKLNLRKPEVKYMGHVLSREGLKPDPDKVQAVSEMPKPTCKQETLSLLGFVNYLAKFLPRLSEIAQPIRELTKKDARFIWSRQHDEAFEQIRKLVTSHPVLKYYDTNAEVTLQCDASEKSSPVILE